MDDKDSGTAGDKKPLYLIVGVLVVGSFALRLIGQFNFEQSTLLFIGIPALLSLLIIKYSDRPKSAYGAVFRTITLFLLMASILFGEGLICVIMAAPIFYGVAALLVFISDFLDKRDKGKLNLSFIIPLLIILAEPLSYVNPPELQTISSSQIFDRTISMESLNESPDFQIDLPGFFQIGFPKPMDIKGSGLEIGDQRAIRFESQTKGIGTLTLEVAAYDNQELIFNVISDDTHINHWLTWKTIHVKLEHLENQKSKITWTSNYTCDLGPSWYFGTLETYAVGKMNEHLIESYFR